MRLDDLAARLEAAGDELAATSTTMGLIDPGAAVLAADAPGGLGDLARDLHRDLTTALVARGRESAAHGARLADTAHTLRLVAANYREADD
ncbi:hypothetical protein ACFFX1_32950 [Dactylosporangium sucinum]|uniref:Excreted virulence factor EspC, type VII ESX diderm n=1 Tax=Dactylosporangium sucinum TaxID=1424081 RepID=A0A917WVR8_9ACTN|nr:hypothetical protein [Dactylosporangium sucinum]GGM34070.1 hypothetical protein GCM10007977_039470 [Dactylosporangium sucinum]